MRSGSVALLSLMLPALAPAAGAPVKDAATAVRIARHMCRGKAHRLHWEAGLEDTGRAWIAETTVRKSGDPLWIVAVPADGSPPSPCRQSHYHFISIEPPASG